VFYALPFVCVCVCTCLCVCVCQSFHKRRVEREKKEAKKRDKLLEQSRKVSKMLDPNVNRLLAPATTSGPPSSPTSGGRRAFSAGHTSRAAKGTGMSSKRNLVKSFNVSGNTDGNQPAPQQR
jgi:hypothetical protein